MQGPTPPAGRRFGSSGAWTPTLLNLVVLIAIEIGAYIALRWTFRAVHGG